ncbi:MAG TPA: TIM barrel protein [Bryobacteraceae bacterium]|nr:TIM barrel protein [Bryobacteraceae bacterium]
MKRREFMIHSGMGAFALSASRGADGQPDSDAKRERVCVSSWSFHNLFTATHDKNAQPLDNPLKALDFPEMIADRYHVHNLEIVSPHFESSEPSYLRELRGRLERAHSRLVNIPVDYDELWEKPALSATDAREREKAVSMYAKWIDIAHEMGALSVRCDPGIINLADPSPTIESYKALVSRGRAKDIRVIVENHGTASKHPEELVQILKASGAGALPDFGNFPDEETRERGLRLMFPLAVTVCHAKLNPSRFDFARCVQVSKAANFHGVYSIEAGGRGDPYEAVQQVVDALLQNL